MNLTASGPNLRQYNAIVHDPHAKYNLLSGLYMTKKKVYPVHFTGQRGQQEASKAFQQNETSTSWHRWRPSLPGLQSRTPLEPCKSLLLNH